MEGGNLGKFAEAWVSRKPSRCIYPELLERCYNISLSKPNKKELIQTSVIPVVSSQF